jgi:hypothetical protein
MSKKKNAGRFILPSLVGIATAAAAAVASYILFVRPWHLRWGTDPGEDELPLPGDELVPEPKLKATHAVTIQASPEKVWPWLVQMGQGRAGFYSYEFVENRMLGLNIENVNRVLPEYQGLKVGDLIPMSPDGFGFPVAILEPNHAMVLFGDTRIPGEGPPIPLKPGEFLAVSWGLYLFPTQDGGTRLVDRMRFDYTPNTPNKMMYWFMEPGFFLMERKMLLGIKQRVEAI